MEVLNIAENTEIYKLNISDLSDSEYSKAFFCMSADRQKKCREYKFPDDKKRCIAADFLVRKVLCEKSGKTSENIELDINKNGKPFTKGEDIFFNISHSGEWVVGVFSDSEVGIDIEKIHPVKINVLNYFCSPADKQYILGKNNISGADVPENCLERFFEVWTFKEAYFKCSGEGISKKAANVNFGDFHKYIEKAEDYILCVYR